MPLSLNTYLSIHFFWKIFFPFTTFPPIKISPAEKLLLGNKSWDFIYATVYIAQKVFCIRITFIYASLCSLKPSLGILYFAKMSYIVHYYIIIAYFDQSVSIYAMFHLWSNINIYSSLLRFYTRPSRCIWLTELRHRTQLHPP